MSCSSDDNPASDSGTIPIAWSDGVLPGCFSVNAEGQQVQFSQGNLQYRASSCTWRFAEHQYNVVGDATVGNVYENGVKCNGVTIRYRPALVLAGHADQRRIRLSVSRQSQCRHAFRIGFRERREWCHSAARQLVYACWSLLYAQYHTRIGMERHVLFQRAGRQLYT